MTDLAAAIGRAQLAKTEKLQRSRDVLARRYDEALAGLPLRLPPKAPEGQVHAWHLYIVRLSDEVPIKRDDLIRFLDREHVGYSVHFIPLHRLQYWRERYALD